MSGAVVDLLEDLEARADRDRRELDGRTQLEAALNETLDETKARSVAFVVLCQKVILDLTEDEALAGLTEGGNDFGVDAIDVADPVDGEFSVTLFSTMRAEMTLRSGLSASLVTGPNTEKSVETSGKCSPFGSS